MPCVESTHEYYYRNQADKSGNCAPGLVVDTELVHSKYLDFYLQSHAGILGSKHGHMLISELS